MTMKRKGRPLLACAVGIAFVSYVQCTTNHQPVGNLRGPDTDAQPIPPVGNLRGPEPVDEGDAATSADVSVLDAAATIDASAPPKKKADAGALLPIGPSPTMHPVGNLRPPPTHDPQ
jgi:hypothetical protein